jgi:predicted helicase
MYDGVELFYKGIEFKYSSNELTESDFYVTQMKFGKKVVDDKNVTDKTVIIFNKNITIRNIPLTSYNYVINGKSAIEWVMERQSITTHKDSSIENNANDYGNSIGNARYGFELLLRVVGIGNKYVTIYLLHQSSYSIG